MPKLSHAFNSINQTDVDITLLLIMTAIYTFYKDTTVPLISYCIFHILTALCSAFELLDCPFDLNIIQLSFTFTAVIFLLTFSPSIMLIFSLWLFCKNSPE